MAACVSSELDREHATARAACQASFTQRCVRRPAATRGECGAAGSSGLARERAPARSVPPELGQSRLEHLPARRIRKPVDEAARTFAMRLTRGGIAVEPGDLRVQPRAIRRQVHQPAFAAPPPAPGPPPAARHDWRGRPRWRPGRSPGRRRTRRPIPMRRRAPSASRASIARDSRSIRAESRSPALAAVPSSAGIAEAGQSRGCTPTRLSAIRWLICTCSAASGVRRARSSRPRPSDRQPRTCSGTRLPRPSVAAPGAAPISVPASHAGIGSHATRAASTAVVSRFASGPPDREVPGHAGAGVHCGVHRPSSIAGGSGASGALRPARGFGRPHHATGGRPAPCARRPAETGPVVARGGGSTRPRIPCAGAVTPAAAYLLLTYFSRRISGTGRPASFRASNAASTMFGLPHRYAMSPSAEGAKSARNCCT